MADSLNKSFQQGSDFAARYGGEEFVILFSGMTKDQSARHVETLCQLVRNFRMPYSASSTGYLTISVGFSVHTFDPLQPNNVLLAQADKALYVAKERGRDQFFSF